MRDGPDRFDVRYISYVCVHIRPNSTKMQDLSKIKGVEGGGLEDQFFLTNPFVLEWSTTYCGGNFSSREREETERNGK